MAYKCGQECTAHRCGQEWGWTGDFPWGTSPCIAYAPVVWLEPESVCLTVLYFFVLQDCRQYPGEEEPGHHGENVNPCGVMLEGGVVKMICSPWPSLSLSLSLSHP